MPIDDDPHVEGLLQYLKEVRGFDFTGYKRASLVRRIRRRMTTIGVGSYDDYLDYLQVHPEEFTPLFDTVLINVTSFFRDADAWAQLRTEIVPGLLRRRGPDEIRIWSAGCATGQEAYSTAILMAELLGADEVRRRVKIYATDVDEDALAYARQGAYEARQLEGLSNEQVAAHFEPSGQQFVLRKELRRSVIFGRNDLVQDAPISRIDLLLCRNTLMYFNAEVQSRILQRLHFALNPDGVLFLGKAEMLLSHGDLFRPVDLRRRFFRTVPVARPARPRSSRQAVDTAVDSSQPLVEAALLWGPVAQVVLDRHQRLVTVNRSAEALFGLGARDLHKPFQDLELSYRPAELRSAVDEAWSTHSTTWVHDAEWSRPGAEDQVLDVQVVPLQAPDAVALGTALSFHDVTRFRQLRRELELANRQLETAYETLQSTNEELETTNEELQSTVEELETTNEELQSTNEELETMNEELQSMNDELEATNEELRARTTEVGDLNIFMRSILRSLRSVIVVADGDLRVQVWNERARELWGLSQEEVLGAHLLGLDIGLPLERLVPTIYEAMTADGSEPVDLDLDAVNRRGRPVVVRVTASGLHDDRSARSGVVLVMNEVDELGRPAAADPEQSTG
jgi:two-component system, chemotaxis family, CheB/CheR fusion protein